MRDGSFRERSGTPKLARSEVGASGFEPRASGLGLRASGFRPRASGFWPRASGLRTPTSGLQAPASSLQPAASSLTPHSGLSLIEILVATGLLVSILVPILFLFSQTVRTSEVGLDELVATFLQSELIEQLQVLPSAVGFRQIVSSPVPNPAPVFPNWHSLPSTGVVFGEANPKLEPVRPPIDSRGWKQFGWPHWTIPPDDPILVALSRLYLTPPPEGFERRLQVYHPLADASGIVDPNLFQIMAAVDWERDFLGTATQKRTQLMGTLLSNPNFNP